jgi:membrane-associated phospholipid phosphatase
VAFGRIQAGAHYFTDCLFSAGLSFLLAAAVVRRLAGDARNRPGRGVRAGP